MDRVEGEPMINDETDSVISMITSGGSAWGIAMLVIAAVLYFADGKSVDECRTRKCQVGQSATLLDHRCVCVSDPEP